MATALALTALVALSACGSSSGTEQAGGAQVASLATTAAGSSDAAQPKETNAQRPRERLDSTPEELEALQVPFDKCLKKSGLGDQTKMKEASDQATRGNGKISKTQMAAYRACEEQYLPLPPWEKDPANPEARDFARAVVKCLKEKGVKYVEVSEDGLSPSFGGEQNDSRSISMGMDLAPQCEREAAAAAK
jgi:hypothetical protein